jgi:hypothetical protein
VTEEIKNRQTAEGATSAVESGLRWTRAPHTMATHLVVKRPARTSVHEDPLAKAWSRVGVFVGV